MAIPYTAPVFREEAFNCPHCEAYAKQEWFTLSFQRGSYGYNAYMDLSICSRCEEKAYWG